MSVCKLSWDSSAFISGPWPLLSPQKAHMPPFLVGSVQGPEASLDESDAHGDLDGSLTPVWPSGKLVLGPCCGPMVPPAGLDEPGQCVALILSGRWWRRSLAGLLVAVLGPTDC